uniref:Uncharacterized protein n=1 Tax=Ananas comosus var. bracteatus TaxID=296719 RepID=A0A6V7Q8N1_ANACO|nr:unnamed protein product [Ananas comosus var. bracteatus]
MVIGIGKPISVRLFVGPVDVLLQSGDRRDSCTGGYFDPTLVQWCTLGAGLSASCRWMIFEHTTLIATAVVELLNRGTRGFIARVHVSDPGLHCEARVGIFEVIVILLAFIGLRYPLGGETCLHVLTSPTIFQVSQAMGIETRREART